MNKTQIENYLNMHIDDLEVLAYFGEITNEIISTINALLSEWEEGVIL